MIIRGIVLDDSIKYVKFHKSPEPSVEVNEELKCIDIFGESSSDISEYINIKDYPIEDDLEYIKLGKYRTATFPDFIITKKTFEDLEINIFIIKLDDENLQMDGEDNYEIKNTVYYFYDRLTILMREDKHTLADLSELIEDIEWIGFEPTGDPSNLIGQVPNAVIRNKTDIEVGYYSINPIDFNGQISVLDWSHAMEGFLEQVKIHVKDMDFSEPVTKLAQEIPTNTNLIRYDFSDLQQDMRGHLVTDHWKYFYMHKLPFELEFIVTQTSTYVRLLHDIQDFNRVTNIASFFVTANDGLKWRVAVEWNFPAENNFDLIEPKGSSDTVGNTIRLTGFLHFFTVSKNKIMYLIEQILNIIQDESSIISKSI